MEDNNRITQSIYRQCKMILFMTRGKHDTLLPTIRKHLDDYSLFVEGYESHAIKHWYDFFERDYTKK